MRSHTASLRSRGRAFPRLPAGGGHPRGGVGGSSLPLPIFSSRFPRHGGDEAGGERKRPPGLGSSPSEAEGGAAPRGRRRGPADPPGSACAAAGRRERRGWGASPSRGWLSRSEGGTERGRNCRLSAILPSPNFKGWGGEKENRGPKLGPPRGSDWKGAKAGVEWGSDIPRRVPLLRFPEPLRARRRCRRLRMWVPLLLLLPELLPAVPAQKLSALTVRPPRRWAPGARRVGPPGRTWAGWCAPPGRRVSAPRPSAAGQRAAPRFGPRIEHPAEVGSSAAACPAARGAARWAAGTAAPSPFSRGEHGPWQLSGSLPWVSAELRANVNVPVNAFIFPKRNNAAVRSAFGPSRVDRFYFIFNYEATWNKPLWLFQAPWC